MSYLTLKANDDSIESTFTPRWASIGTGGMQYRAVGSEEWTHISKGTSITIDTNGIELKADTVRTANTVYSHFAMTGSISASGDVTSLTNGVGGDCTLNQYCYYYMFQGCTALTTAPALPATTLAIFCYMGMFTGCTSLVTSPILPATTLTQRCYSNMFLQCTSLTTAPALPALTLADECYMGMFSECTSLTTPPPALPATTMKDECYCGLFHKCSALTVAPELPATNLAMYCYTQMFYECTSLTAAPALPATTLADYCYAQMFAYSSLTTAPTLSATTLSNGCYSGMFDSCYALTVAPELPATTLVDECYYEMFKNCSALTGYITPEPGCTIIHNFPSTTAADWNTDMYSGLNTASTVPATPSSNVNYYFGTPPTPTTVEGKVINCIA